MITYDDLMRLDLNAYSEEARNWKTLADALATRATELDQKLKKLDGWTGAAAEGAKATFAGHRKQYQDVSTAIARIPPVLDQAALRFGEIRTEVNRLLDEARHNGWTFDPAGAVVAPGPPPAPMSNLEPEARRLQDTMASVLDRARRIDGETAQVLRSLHPGHAGFAGPDQATVAAAATPIPPRTTTPTEVKKWWDSLSPMQQESLLYTHAGEIGALDGVPATARDRANRSRLTEMKAQLVAEQQRLNGLGDRRIGPDNDRLAEIDAKLKGIESIESRLGKGSPPHQPAFLLGIDTNGNGRAIVAMGNPDTAANVCTYVPGTGAKLAGVDGEMDRADRMVNAAKAVDEGKTTSVIAWVGYDAPQHPILEAGFDKYADNAKQNLDRFQDGLRATHEGPRSHNMVLGHSYGSTVVGHAARDERLDVDGVIFVGSPGVGVDKIDDLHLPHDQVYATVAKNDAINITNNPRSFEDPIEMSLDIHGPNPADPRFGGRPFESDPGEPAWPIGSEAAHSAYWDPGNRSLDNIGRIIVGQPTR
ncbi:alpha/beta hydrolase family protein [Kibdelosporangium philippinense]|uniref:Alpha/beta hydrolase family protein n=1 Tax=Kibdelosporangium philippinense TaxID=211113 RepID=A0ABS8ZQJ6_9PSEU|nr:alpha/beta hydrolase [Kibdelosporangium philippinense]MCE7010011.1 alpha/beta hydrolase family protein [Kibdelosporangium philippinense]